ncbi:hypothetical protein MHU86_20672 [Fragilaria crotonensis]|nr:hypothetical protein MHU86_20672 [Fragilaria crotonensis]
MKTTTFLLASILARPSLQAGLRSQAGDEGSQNECVTCSYLELFDICVPKEKSPSGSKWACDFQGKDEKVDSDLWGCLMTGVDSASCTGATNGTCIWCAEPVLGLCVTPEVAAKLNFLPFFTCDSHITPVSLL